MVISATRARSSRRAQAKLFGTFVIFTARRHPVGGRALLRPARAALPHRLLRPVRHHGVHRRLAQAGRHAGAWPSPRIIVLLVVNNRNMLGQDIRFGSFAAAYFMGDGNDFGWGLIVMLPFTLYLMIGKRRLLTRADRAGRARWWPSSASSGRSRAARRWRWPAACCCSGRPSPSGSCCSSAFAAVGVVGGGAAGAAHLLRAP